MTVIVKMMGSEDAPDSDTRKTFHLYTDILKVEFFREGREAYAWLWFSPAPFSPNDGTFQIQKEMFLLIGNVYVMNNDGKTISSFGPTPLVSDDEYEVQCIECHTTIRSADGRNAQQLAVDNGWVASKDGFLCERPGCLDQWSRRNGNITSAPPTSRRSRG